MEFKEFSNPEEMDYDINSSLRSSDDTPTTSNTSTVNPYAEQLIDLIGILEDVTDEEIEVQYGITTQEYYYPTEETIQKVTAKLNSRTR